jgi:hypothetical protein
MTFDGSASSDPDGDVLTYTWDFGDGSTGTGVQPTHTYATLGSFNVTLAVDDGRGGVHSASTTVVISNRAPVADAGPDQAGEVGTPVTLNGSGSFDPDSDALSYEWRDAANNIIGTTPVVTLSLGAGAYPFRLTVRDVHGDASSDIVAVTVQDTTPPSVAITTPDNVALVNGIPVTISWTASDNGALSGFDVSFSSDGGTTYASIPGCTALAGAARSCMWAVPGPNTTQGRFRVVARDAAGLMASDDSSVSIVSPSIQVTSPNTNVIWGVGSTHAIAWTSNLPSSANVRIQVSRNGGSTWTTLTSSTPNDGSYNWLVTGSTTSSARIRVSWTSNTAVQDASDVNFRIATPSLTVTVPNDGSDVWTIGTAQTIRWTHNLGATDTVIVQISRNGGSSWTTIASGVPNGAVNAGSHVWTVTGPASTQARIRVLWTPNTSVNDRSDRSFQIR